MHILLKDPSEKIKSESHIKCALNITIDTRANGTGYIILPCNDPHRAWGEWNDYVEEIPYFLIPALKDDTPSFIGMVNGDGRNDVLFKWRTKLEITHKFTEKQIENSIRAINEYILMSLWQITSYSKLCFVHVKKTPNRTQQKNKTYIMSLRINLLGKMILFHFMITFIVLMEYIINH